MLESPAQPARAPGPLERIATGQALSRDRSNGSDLSTPADAGGLGAPPQMTAPVPAASAGVAEDAEPDLDADGAFDI